MSSPNSTVSSPSPLRPAHHAYWCTVCEAHFLHKSSWRRHEESAHPLALPDGERSWACGFCAFILPTRDRYLAHVAAHYEAGLTKADWNHSNAIFGLLHQPDIVPAWLHLVEERHGHLPAESRPQLAWSARMTGRARRGVQARNLQDLLEAYPSVPDCSVEEASILARLAFDLAAIRYRTPRSSGFGDDSGENSHGTGNNNNNNNNNNNSNSNAIGSDSTARPLHPVPLQHHRCAAPLSAARLAAMYGGWVGHVAQGRRPVLVERDPATLQGPWRTLRERGERAPGSDSSDGNSNS